MDKYVVQRLSAPCGSGLDREIWPARQRPKRVGSNKHDHSKAVSFMNIGRSTYVTPSLPGRNAPPLPLLENLGDVWITRSQRLEQKLTYGEPETARKRGRRNYKTRDENQAGLLAATGCHVQQSPYGAGPDSSVSRSHPHVGSTHARVRLSSHTLANYPCHSPCLSKSAWRAEFTPTFLFPLYCLFFAISFQAGNHSNRTGRRSLASPAMCNLFTRAFRLPHDYRLPRTSSRKKM